MSLNLFRHTFLVISCFISLKLVGQVIPSNTCETESGSSVFIPKNTAIYTLGSCTTSTGDILITGYLINQKTSPAIYSAFCMRLQPDGSTVWKHYYLDENKQSIRQSFSYHDVLQLKDGNYALLGKIGNGETGAEDILITKISPDGNVIWSKTYYSTLPLQIGRVNKLAYERFTEDQYTGDLIFSGTHDFHGIAITSVDQNNGTVRWSKGFKFWADAKPFGVIPEKDHHILFLLGSDLMEKTKITTIKIDKNSGDTLSSKHLQQIGNLTDPRLAYAETVVKKENGGYLLGAFTTDNLVYPIYSGLHDLYHSAVLELDPDLKFKKSYGFKNRFESGAIQVSSTISLFPDGSGVFYMLNNGFNYSGDGMISIFKDGKIYNQRRITDAQRKGGHHLPFVKTSSGGFMSANVFINPDQPGNFEFGFKLYTIHPADSITPCLGKPDSSTSTYPIYYEDILENYYSVIPLVYKEGKARPLTPVSFDWERIESCRQNSNCDSLGLFIDKESACVGNAIQIKTIKNQGCGSIIPLEYEEGVEKDIFKTSDSTYLFVPSRPGKYEFRASMMGCSLIEKTASVIILPAVTQLNLGTDTSLCEGTTLLLNAGDGFQDYQWQDGSTEKQFEVKLPGKYYVDVQNACGLKLSDTIEIVAHPKVDVQLGDDKTICYSEDVLLQVPSTLLKYEWSSANGISLSNEARLNFRAENSDTYFLKVEYQKGCFSFDTVNITVNKPINVFLGADTSICEGSKLLLNAGEGYASYNWNTGSTNSTISVEKEGSYSVRVFNDLGCSMEDTIILLAVYARPTPFLGEDRPVCVDQPQTLRPFGQFAKYVWQDGSIDATMVVSKAGEYWVEVQDSNGCFGIDTINITGLKFPPADFLKQDTVICNYSSIELIPDENFNHYEWSTGSISRSIQVKTQGLYRLTVTDEFNCRGTDSILISTKDCLKGVFLPNAFSPNGDQKNDLFRAQVFGQLQKFELRIFNRFGQLIFETTNPESGWNGTLNGMLQNTGTFIWTCMYQLIGEPLEQKKGILQLIR